MKLIRTHDGILGWMVDGRIKWCPTVENLKAQGLIHWDFDQVEYVAFCKDVDYAIAHMVKTSHTVAEFGIFGSFMYTTTEEDEREF